MNLESDRVGTQLGDHIRSRREAAGLTQEGLARKADLPLGAVQRAELAKHQPRLETLVKIAEALDCTLADLFKEAA